MMVATDAAWARTAIAASGPRTIEINSVFAVPHSLPPWGGHDCIRYEQVGDGSEGPIYLRSHGTNFNILPRPWLGQQIDGCYSIGPGLVGEQQRTVVLAQVFRGNWDALAVLAEDHRWPEVPLIKVTRQYGLRCLLFSGYL